MGLLLHGAVPKSLTKWLTVGWTFPGAFPALTASGKAYSPFLETLLQSGFGTAPHALYSILKAHRSPTVGAVITGHDVHVLKTLL